MPDFEYIDSLTCHGHSRNGRFERMVQSRREVWSGSDGSGLLRTQFIKSVFFTAQQQARWEAQHDPAASGQSPPDDMLFAPGCWNGPRQRLAAMALGAGSGEPIRLPGPNTLQGIKQLIGEALVPAGLRRAFFDRCAGLDGARVDLEAFDQIGRSGIAVVRDELDRREELIFNADSGELIGTRQVLLTDARYAPAGATIGRSCIMTRKLVLALPDDVPPAPGPPCAPPGGGRGTPIRLGLRLMTGRFADLRPHAGQWLRDGTITEREHAVLHRQQQPTDRKSGPDPPSAWEDGPRR